MKTGLRSLGIVFPIIMVAAAGSGFRLRVQAAAPTNLPESTLPVNEQIGRFGGTLVVSQRSEPKTLNPVTAADTSSRDIIGLLMADLIHINRETQLTEPAVAASWAVSPDGLRYTLHLRPGLRFSDGHPATADDVVFTFHTYLDEKIHSPQRDLLLISGQPVAVTKIDQYTVAVRLARRYAAAERLFDGIAILPQHLLQASYKQGQIANVWGLNSPPGSIAGLGPFRLKTYVPGQRVVLERNPYYWKTDTKGQRLPYLERIVCLFTPNADAEAMRFEAGETDVISRLNAADFAVLEKQERSRGFHLYDLGPGLEYSFLFFNENAAAPGDHASLAHKQEWFRQVGFRQAVSDSIDRLSLVRLAYRGRAHALGDQVSPGNRRWVDVKVEVPVRSVPRAQRCLQDDKFFAKGDGLLVDSRGEPVEFSLAVNAGNTEQVQMATLIQQDLREVGMDVELELLDFHTLLDRIFTSFKYEAAIMALADGDADPNSEMNVLTSSGGTHVWSLRPEKEQAPWQLEIDRLMHEQLTARSYGERKRLYDKVQEIIGEEVPAVFLVSPDILVGAKDRVGNFRPAILGNYTLWNADHIFIKQEHKTAGHS